MFVATVLGYVQKFTASTAQNLRSGPQNRNTSQDTADSDKFPYKGYTLSVKTTSSGRLRRNPKKKGGPRPPFVSVRKRPV
jgi:hypothetical protein